MGARAVCRARPRLLSRACRCTAGKQRPAVPDRRAGAAPGERGGTAALGRCPRDGAVLPRLHHEKSTREDSGVQGRAAGRTRRRAGAAPLLCRGGWGCWPGPHAWHRERVALLVRVGLGAELLQGWKRGGKRGTAAPAAPAGVTWQARTWPQTGAVLPVLGAMAQDLEQLGSLPVIPETPAAYLRNNC